MGFALVLTRFVEAEVFFEFAEWISATFIVGNVVSKFAPPTK